MFSPSLRSFEYSVLITTEASKLKKWYSDQPYAIPAGVCSWRCLSMGGLEVTWTLGGCVFSCLCWMVLWPRGRTPLMGDPAPSVGSLAGEDPVAIRARRLAVFSLTFGVKPVLGSCSSGLKHWALLSGASRVDIYIALISCALTPHCAP